MRFLKHDRMAFVLNLLSDKFLLLLNHLYKANLKITALKKISLKKLRIFRNLWKVFRLMHEGDRFLSKDCSVLMQLHELQKKAIILDNNVTNFKYSAN